MRDACSRARAAIANGQLSDAQGNAIARGLRCSLPGVDAAAQRGVLLDERIAELTSRGLSYSDALVTADDELRKPRR